MEKQQRTGMYINTRMEHWKPTKNQQKPYKRPLLSLQVSQTPNILLKHSQKLQIKSV